MQDLRVAGEHFKTGTTGPIEQLLVSPLSPLQIVLAKVMAMTVVILLGTLVVVGVPFVGSAWLFFAMVALYASTSSGLGVLAATFARATRARSA